MWNRTIVAATVIAIAVVAACPSVAGAMCCPVPCIDCVLFSAGQANVVVMDREHGTVRLIPNIVITGTAADFALIVPTPALPAFKEVSSAIWAEARELTLPVQASRRNDTFGCGGDEMVAWAPSVPFSGGAEVVVHDRETVGAFDASVLSSDNPNALVEWLTANGYALPAGSAAKFAPYVARGWFFTAMKLNLTDPRNQVPPGGWNNQVNPVEIEFAATTFEAALPIVSINRAAWMSILFYIVDDHRSALLGATTLYANRLSRKEHDAIRDSYPALAKYTAPGRFVTALSILFTETDSMSMSIFLERAPTDAEFRRGIDLGSAGLEVWLVVLGLALQRWARSSRRRTQPLTVR